MSNEEKKEVKLNLTPKDSLKSSTSHANSNYPDSELIVTSFQKEEDVGDKKPDNLKQKKDYYGTLIDKVTKQHHITFRDIVAGKQIADIKEVESYKEYNAFEEQINPQCKCFIF